VREIMALVRREKIPLVRFEKGVRKDEVMKKALRKFRPQEGVLFVGVAQEKARVPRTIRKRFGDGGSIPWIDYTSAMVNFYYFYCVDEDFGPFFIKLVLLLFPVYRQTLPQWARVCETPTPEAWDSL
jgi:hypothetical protein